MNKLKKQYTAKTLNTMAKKFDKEERHFFRNFNNMTTIGLNQENHFLLNENMQIIIQINHKQKKEEIDKIKEYNKTFQKEIMQLEFLCEKKQCNRDEFMNKITQLQNQLLDESEIIPIFKGFAKLIDIKKDKTKLKQLTIFDIENIDDLGFKLPISESQQRMLKLDFVEDKIIQAFGLKQLSIFQIKNQKDLQISIWLPL